MLYLDDVCVKSPKTNYVGKEIKPSIYRYVAKYFSNIDVVLIDIERVGIIVLGYKLDFRYLSIVVVEYRIDLKGYYLDKKKVEKITL
jgi:hypothetical protein